MPILQRIEYPEIIFGFVSPIGTDIAPIVSEFKTFFLEAGYNVVEIKVTDIFHTIKNYITPDDDLKRHEPFERYSSYIKYGNKLRSHFDDDSILASWTISRIVRRRTRLNSENKDVYQRTAYLLHQFKRKEEIDLLRSVYGEAFFQISLYSRRGARVDYLSRIFASGHASSSPQDHRHLAEQIIQIDENEKDAPHGQRVAKIFHDADVIISVDGGLDHKIQVRRFCELLFGSNQISPNRMEYGMFAAKAASLQTLDLSRQVGAAIFSKTDEIISFGSNEVPRAGGGTYWCDSPFDDREYKRGADTNDRKKKEVLIDILASMGINEEITELLKRPSVADSRFMDALEYGRIVHAEMNAILGAGRQGIPTQGSKLYCTTFPCHVCARHIVAAGVQEVVFLEPYPKSLASELHADSIDVEGAERGRFRDYPSVKFEHFFGVCPRRYIELFGRSKRKDSDGKYQEYPANKKRPILNIRAPSYTANERWVIEMLQQRSFAHGISEIETME